MTNLPDGTALYHAVSLLRLVQSENKQGCTCWPGDNAHCLYDSIDEFLQDFQEES